MTHAGWRGTVACIAANTVRKMAEEFGSDPKDVVTRIGPCISQKYFECDRDVIDAVEAMPTDGSGTWFYREETGKYHVSLADLNALVLQDAGILPEHIDRADACTYANADLYFSHRRQGRNRGGQAALLMMKRNEA